MANEALTKEERRLERRQKRKVKMQKGRTSSMVEHRSVGGVIADIVIIILCGLVAFCCIIPMWHVLMSSLSDGKTLLAHEGMVWWPVGTPTLAGYSLVFQSSDFIRGFLVAVFYTAATTALGFFVSLTGGYAMSRPSKLKSVMTVFVMITMMFGGGMVPTYMVVRALGMVGTPLAVIIPGCTNAMYLVMMMNAFLTIPADLFEAARIDGAGHFRICFSIMMPLAMNMGTVIILNLVVGTWNAWVPASIYLSNEHDWWPLQLIIQEMVNNSKNFLQSSNPNYSRYLIQYAVVILSCLPIIIAFPFFQKKMEQATIVGAVKG